MASLGRLHVVVWDDPSGLATAFSTLGLSDLAQTADGSPFELHWIVKHRFLPAEQTEAIAFLAQLAAVAEQPQAAFDWQTRVQVPSGVPGFNSCREVWLHPALVEGDPDTLNDPQGAVKVLYVIPLTEYESFVLTRSGVSALREYACVNDIDLLRPR
ncbi:MAG: suppressor of fused domain protein [Acidobacteriota bacterium]